LMSAMAYAIVFAAPAQQTAHLAKPAVRAARPVVMVKVLVAAPPAVPLPPRAIAPDPATIAEQASRVAARVSDKVPASLAPYFDTFIYVSKAASGPWAQRLFLFRKSDDGTLAFEQSFPVSTGRERSEQYFTATPTGLFELDVHRFFPMAR